VAIIKSLITTSLKGVCPCCGKGRLFCGLLDTASNCANCNFDFTKLEVGDGHIYFVIITIGSLVAGLATYVEFKYEPALWVHALLWLPIITIGSLGLSRFFKALLLNMEYRSRF